MTVSKGFYPGYLFIKESNTLILSYGISETMQYEKTWPDEILSSNETLKEHMGGKVPRYGESYVCKSYKINFNNDKVEYTDYKTERSLPETEIITDFEFT